MTKIHAQDVGGHRIESLRDIVQRFLKQFDGAQDEGSKKVHALLKENGVTVWDPNNVQIKKVGYYDNHIIINDVWTFLSWNLNLTGVNYAKYGDAESGEVLRISIKILNEQERWHDLLLGRGDNVNVGLYFIKDWNIDISKKGQSIFHIDRATYWENRQIPPISLENNNHPQANQSTGDAVMPEQAK